MTEGRYQFGTHTCLQVMCEDGGYLVSNSPSLLSSTIQNHGTSVAPCESGWATRYADAYRLEIDHFLDVLEGLCNMMIVMIMIIVGVVVVMMMMMIEKEEEE